MAEVTFPNMSVGIYPLERLSKVQDGLEQLQEEWWADVSEPQGDADTRADWSVDENGVWHMDVPPVDEWEDVCDDDDDDDMMDVDVPWEEEPFESQPPLEPVVAHEYPTLSSEISQTYEIAELDTDVLLQPPTDVQSDSGAGGDNDEDSVTSGWNRFDIIPSVPPDHAFYNTPSSTPSKPFLARLSREYRVLSNSLPGTSQSMLSFATINMLSIDSIIVRAFEERTDLLRSIIIGPENTPYEDAPFVIDWMLESTFPYSPPKAHFLSWTNGNGRG
jgi:ubiquitin-conjugating enzyme E2 O